MDTSLSTFILLMSATLALGQRPFFAGIKPIGYPETPNITDTLGDRFGEVDGTTPRLPVEAHGDLGLIDRLSKLPVDKQPFWFINWQAYETHRQNPQTYPQRPSSFNDPIPTTNDANSGAVTSTSVATSSNSSSTSNSVSTANRFGEPNSNVTPVVASTSDNKNVGSKPDSEAKPVAVSSDKKETSKEKPAVLNSDSSNSNSTSSVSTSSVSTSSVSTNSNSNSTNSNSDSTNSNSEPEKKIEEVAPLLPSPIEPEAAPVDGLKLKEDTSAEKKFRYFRRP